jgi:hypothetical protein
MCDPVTGTITLASVAGWASVASVAVGYVSASKAADKQDDANRDNYAQQSEAASRQYAETNKQAAQEMSQRAHEGMVERARLRVISGESGLSGVTTDKIAGESDFNQGTDIASIESNRRAQNLQTQSNANGLRATTQSRLAAISRPSLLGTGLQIAGAGADYYGEKSRLSRIGSSKSVRSID